MNLESAKKTAKRLAPNEAKLRANARPGMGRGRKDEVQSTKDEKGRSCGIEGVVSGQLSVEAIRKGARGNRGMGNREKGTGKREKEMRISDFGLRNGGRCQWRRPAGERGRIVECGIRNAEWGNAERGWGNQSRESAAAEPVTNHEPRITNHESRKPQWPNKAICSQSQGRNGERPHVAPCG